MKVLVLFLNPEVGVEEERLRQMSKPNHLLGGL